MINLIIILYRMNSLFVKCNEYDMLKKKLKYIEDWGLLEIY